MAVRLLWGTFCPLAVLTGVTSSCSSRVAVAVQEGWDAEGFRVVGVVNSWQCQRLCVYTTGCSRVAFHPQTGSCSLRLDPPPASDQHLTGATSVCKVSQIGSYGYYRYYC